MATISTALQQGSEVRVYNDQGTWVFSLSVDMRESQSLMGYTSDTVTIRRGKNAYVYNATGTLIRSLSL